MWVLRVLNGSRHHFRAARAAVMVAIAAIEIAAAPARASAACPSPRPPYLTLRYDEDYGALRDPSCRTDFLDVLKYIPLAEEGTTYLSTGADLRVKYEYFHNALWGQGVQDPNGYILQRYLLHGDLRIGRSLRGFAQFQSALEDGRDGGPRPTDEDKLEVNQAFVDAIAPLDDQTVLTLRMGRQEMAYGSQRLVSVREAPNVRLTFDAVRFLLTVPGGRIDAFLARPVDVHPGIFDDRPDGSRWFWGLYTVAAAPLLPDGHTDVYYFGLHNDDATFNQGTAVERRHTLGLRLWGRPGGWEYNVELMLQLGSFGSGSIVAWGAASDTSYTFSRLPLRPRVGVRANVNSGDRNPGSHNLQTFNALFPRGNYFGEIAILGPANLLDVHPYLSVQVTDRLAVTVDALAFFRQSDGDGIYSPSGALLRSASGGGSHHVGEQVGIQPEWRVDQHLTLVANYTHFFAGPFLKDSGPGKDIDYVAAWVQYRF